MTEINIPKNFYVYGKYYNEFAPNVDTNNVIAIYVNPAVVKEPINSLEGFFVSELPLVKKGDKGVRKDWQLNIERKCMGSFEEKYNGKFIPFER